MNYIWFVITLCIHGGWTMDAIGKLTEHECKEITPNISSKSFNSKEECVAEANAMVLKRKAGDPLMAVWCEQMPGKSAAL